MGNWLICGVRVVGNIMNAGAAARECLLVPETMYLYAVTETASTAAGHAGT